MIYRVIGIMSGSSLDGLDLAFCEITEAGGNWSFEIAEVDCITYSAGWKEQLRHQESLSALDYQLLHVLFGRFIGEQVNLFIDRFQLHHRVQLIASHGHTSFHLPGQHMTAQLGDGASIAAITGLPVISDLRSVDVALGGQGAPIVPIGHTLLFKDYHCFLNIGGIANISYYSGGKYHAYDVCAANRVLNLLVEEKGLAYDEGGAIARMGVVDQPLLAALNGLAYYAAGYPKSLPNSFGTDIVFPMIKAAGISTEHALSTYVEHMAVQIGHAFKAVDFDMPATNMLVTGGGAMNAFLMERLAHYLEPYHIIPVVPEEKLVHNKEALIMALMGVLRWREEVNVPASVTGAKRDSVGGALWMGG